MKIAISGTHGSGKTTIALDVASKLKKMNKVVTLMPEVARESPYLISGEQSPNAQLQIYGSQIDSEMRYEVGSDILITDRALVDHVAYMHLFFPDQVEFFDAMKSFAKAYMSTYDYVFQTSAIYDPKKTDDVLRPEDQELQEQAHEEITRLLTELYPAFIQLPSDPETDLTQFIIEKIGF